MSKSWYEDASFPKGGVDQSSAFWKQPARPDAGGMYVKTTRFGVNVRARSSPGARRVGGTRALLSRLVNARVGGSHFVVQHLDTVYSVGPAVPQTSLSGRVVQVIAISKGNVYVAEPGGNLWVIADNTTGEDPPLNFTGVMFSAQNNQKLYIVDGTNYCVYSPVTGAVSTWTATAGNLPVDSDGNFARLICTWRGRTVLSGLVKDSQNIFMSAVSDPTDWEYEDPDPDEEDAVALNLSPLGLIGEPVMALIPVSDDVLVVGCTNSVYAIRGDPRNGGSIDRITDKVGMVWGQPYAKAADGTLFFFSNRTGVMRMNPTSLGPPVKVSGPIDQYLVDLDTGKNHVRMEWDDRFQTLHMFVTDLREPTATTHFAYEVGPEENRIGAWWLDRFKNKDMDPLCCCTLDGNEPGNRVVLIGSWDGYVRMFDPTAAKDDLFEVESEVWIGPLLTPNMDEIVLHTLQAVLAETSGDVTYAVHVGRSAQEAFESEPELDGVWEAGRGPAEAIRTSGHAIYVKITAKNPWQLEQVRAEVSATGKIRRKG